MRSLFAAIAMAAVAGTSTAASPLTLAYCITDDPSGGYIYTFTLTLDNHDGSWESGQGYNWITFGDVFLADSNFPDFVGFLPAPAPFDDEGYSYSGGGHNGPTLLDFGVDNDFRGWIPANVGDSITWSGHSNIFLGADEMEWSNLVGSGVHADFETAVYTGGCGCPADFDGDGFVTGDDFDAYVIAFEAGDDDADFNNDGFVTGDDFDAYVTAFEAGC